MSKYFKKYKQLFKSFLEQIIHGVLNNLDLLINRSFRNSSQKDFDYKLNSITIDTTNYVSELCFIGGSYGTDKSIFSNKTPFKHSYTSVYNIIFSHLRDKDINFAEIGILDNASIKMWRDYFTHAKIDGYENSKKLLSNAKNDNLKDTRYFEIDVKNSDNIKNAFIKSGKIYDVIIDDSTHLFQDELNIINIAKNFLKPGGYLIIEDIFSKKRMYSEKKFYEAIKNIKSEFKDIFFINCKNKYNYGGIWFNHKILVFIK